VSSSDAHRLSEQTYWNDPNVAADLRSRQSGVTEYAVECEERFPRNAHVLDLGCGAGDDSGYFAEKGHDVIAIDLSAPLIDIAAQRYADQPNLEFRVGDVRRPFAVSGQSLDVVYARLSLQYFDHATTLGIFGEIAWVLRPGGQFFFACRSTDDPLYGKGDELEPDFFELDNHTRHFFHPDYATELLEENGFTKIEVVTGEQRLYGYHSAYVRCSAVKP
jgi:SAM-dependent methyltransferase